MNDSDRAGQGDELLDAYDLTLSGVADAIVLEELAELGRYESSDQRVFRVSGEDLLRLRLALVERCGEHQLHPGGALWAERRVRAHTALGASDPAVVLSGERCLVR